MLSKVACSKCTAG